MSGAQRQRRPKTPAQRKRDQRRRDDALARANLMRLPRIAMPEAMGEYLRGTGFLPMTAEDTPETIARGVEALLGMVE